MERKGKKRNGMYLSKGKEWKRMELSNLDWMFKINELKWMECK